jgi:hypothetical protein
MRTAPEGAVFLPGVFWGIEVSGLTLVFLLTQDLFRLRRVTWKRPPSNQGVLLLVRVLLRRTSLHSGLAPWARRERAIHAPHASRRIHAALPTPRNLRSACTQVATGGVCAIAHQDQKQIKSTTPSCSSPACRRWGPGDRHRRQAVLLQVGAVFKDADSTDTTYCDFGRPSLGVA